MRNGFDGVYDFGCENRKAEHKCSAFLFLPGIFFIGIEGRLIYCVKWRVMHPRGRADIVVFRLFLSDAVPAADFNMYWTVWRFNLRCFSR